MLYVFTSAAWNYLPKAQILANSVRKYLPEGKMILALPDLLTDDVDIKKYNFDEVIPLNKDLCPIANLNAWIFSHTIVELATAIKPYVLKQLLNRPDCDAVLYFDPDVELFSRLDDLLENFRDASILLTPHITSPEKKEENVINYELCPLQFGVYNFGFVGVKNTPVGKEYADWWKKRLERFCYSDIPNGIFTDQKWNDIVPGIFPEVKILRETRFNVAAWNTTNRKIVKKENGQWEVDGKPIGFYHFTGLDSGAHHNMVRQFSCNPADQIEFVDNYVRKMNLAAQDPLCQRPWAFSNFLDGVKIDPAMRVYVRDDKNVAKIFKNPFDPRETPRNFRQWYHDNIMPSKNSEVQLCSKYISRLQAVMAEQQETIRIIENSRCWRMTAPLRKLLDWIKKIKIFVLFRKTIKNLREHGIKVTLQKVYGFLARSGRPAAPESEQPQPEPEIPEKIDLTITKDLTDQLVSHSPNKPNLQNLTVAVPVYNGLVHLKKLLPSLLKNTPDEVELLFIDDASPDQEVYPFLQSMAERHPRIRLLQNKKNLGFVKTANRILKETKHHVLLLNSDTEVPAHWLDCLTCRLADDVASVTPFSNAAALFSFPFLENSNRLLLEYFTVDEISHAFSNFELPDEYQNASVGVGFCMLMNRKAIDTVGLFDEENFDIGYGEEADWCVRCSDAGFKNLIAPNLFVAHYGGGSFTPDQKTRIGFSHEKIFSIKHPDFHGKWFLPHLMKTDVYWNVLMNLACVRLFSIKRLKPLLFFTHPFSGGAVDYLQSFIRENRENSIFAIRPGQNEIILDLYYKDYHFNMKFQSLDCLLDPQTAMQNCHEIIINHLLGWQWIFQKENLTVEAYEMIISKLLSVKQLFSAEMRFMMHDFLSVCPRYNLLDKNDKFCHPDRSVNRCSGCIPALFQLNGITQLSEIQQWRDLSNRLLAECKECRFFSSSTQKITEKVLESVNSIGTVVPHQGIKHYEPMETFPATPITIGVVGNINLCKGARFLADLASYLKVNAPGVRIVIIGPVDHPPYPDNVIVHGHYERDNLPDLLRHYGVNIGFISSIWPETFNYVTQELMELGLPLVCFDLGAPAERISKWKNGMIIPEISPEAAWKTIQALHDKINHPKYQGAFGNLVG